MEIQVNLEKHQDIKILISYFLPEFHLGVKKSTDRKLFKMTQHKWTKCVHKSACTRESRIKKIASFNFKCFGSKVRKQKFDDQNSYEGNISKQLSADTSSDSEKIACKKDIFIMSFKVL